jgi:hypothetical protein
MTPHPPVGDDPANQTAPLGCAGLPGFPGSNTFPDRAENTPEAPENPYNFDCNFVVFFTCTLSCRPNEDVAVLRTIGAREEKRAVARRTRAGGGITGRWRYTPPDVGMCR